MATLRTEVPTPASPKKPSAVVCARVAFPVIEYVLSDRQAEFMSFSPASARPAWACLRSKNGFWLGNRCDSVACAAAATAASAEDPAAGFGVR